MTGTRNLAPLLIAGLVGAAAASAILWPQASGIPLKPPEETTAPAAPAAAATGDTGAQLARIESSIGRLDARVAELDHRLEAALGLLEARRATTDPTAPVAVDAAALQRAIEGAAEKKERTKYDTLNDQQLLAEARRLHLEAKDPLGARRALDLLLARNLDPLDRGRALTELGILQRSGGDLEASSATLRQVVDTHGLGSEIGAEAAYQLIWSNWSQDRTAALRLADTVARDAGSESVRMHARWSAAMLAHELGDLARARADYTAILRDCADKPHHQGIASDVKRRLESLGSR